MVNKMLYQKKNLGNFELLKPLPCKIEYNKYGSDEFYVIATDLPMFYGSGKDIEKAFNMLDWKILKFYVNLKDNEIRACVDNKTQRAWDFIDSLLKEKPIKKK